MSRSGRWISPRDIRPNARLRLFCLPHAGSGSAAFYRWRGKLPEGVDLCPIHLPGREMRLAEAPYTDAGKLVNELMAVVTPYLDCPFTIFGHSMGALLGYEWARRMRETGHSPTVLIVSGRNAPHLPKPHEDLHRLKGDELAAELCARYGGLPGGLLEDAELRGVFLPILRADLQVVETYSVPGGVTLSCPIVALAGRDDRSVFAEGLDAWGELTAGGLQTTLFEGDHFYLHSEKLRPFLEYLSLRLHSVMGQSAR